MIMTAVETVTITEPKGKGRTSLEKCGERRATATLLSTVPGGYRNPLISTLGVQPAEAWCPNQGSWGPRCRDWGGGVALETEDLCPWFSPGDCVGPTPPTWVRILFLETPVCSLPAVGLVPSEIPIL